MIDFGVSKGINLFLGSIGVLQVQPRIHIQVYVILGAPLRHISNSTVTTAQVRSATGNSEAVSLQAQNEPELYVLGGSVETSTINVDQ
jgi:hypothetical protein